MLVGMDTLKGNLGLEQCSAPKHLVFGDHVTCRASVYTTVYFLCNIGQLDYAKSYFFLSQAPANLAHSFGARHWVLGAQQITGTQ